MFDFSKVTNYWYFLKENTVQSLGEVFEFWSVRIYLSAAVFLNAVAWGFMFFIKNRAEQDLIILHYNVDFGVDLIGRASQLNIIPVLGSVVIAVNLFLILVFASSKNFGFLSHLLLFTAVAVNLFLLISLSSIYLINFG